MPKRRANKADQWMPPRVYRGKSAYEWHPRSGGAKRLCGLDASESEVWYQYRIAVGDVSTKTCEWLAGEYFKDPKYTNRAPRTKKDYSRYWEKLKPTFGSVLVNNIKSEHVRKYVYLRGRESATMANKERKFLSILFNYGYTRGEVRANPCISVGKLDEFARDRYVTDDEYMEFMEFADPMLKVFMEISYVCAARGQDVRKITLNDITDEGLFIEQQKTGKKQIKLWSGRLRAVVSEGRHLRKDLKVSSIYLLNTSTGGPYSEGGLKSLWRRARARYKKAKGKDIDWTFHDIKAKGISDYEGDKQTFSGHKTRSMMERYNRSVDKVATIDFKNIRK